MGTGATLCPTSAGPAASTEPATFHHSPCLLHRPSAHAGPGLDKPAAATAPAPPHIRRNPDPRCRDHVPCFHLIFNDVDCVRLKVWQVKGLWTCVCVRYETPKPLLIRRCRMRATKPPNDPMKKPTSAVSTSSSTSSRHRFLFCSSAFLASVHTHAYAHLH